MEALAGRGNVAEALHAYDRLRVLLREALGIAPSPAVQAVHRRLLQSADDWSCSACARMSSRHHAAAGL
jgi:DNA-binding SARP family transcriptional activator